MVGSNINRKGFIYNTHENAERAYYISAFIKKCTKPRESISMENLEILIHRKLREESKWFPIPKRAVPYLVQTAIELGILERDSYKEGYINRWGARGYVVNTCSPDIPDGLPLDLKLLEKDRLAYLKYYLDSDGLVLLYLSKKIHEEGKIELAEMVKGNQVEQMWQAIFKESLSHVKDRRLRSEMQELLRSSRFLKERPRAKGKTLEHVRKQRVTPHLELLVDLGILDRIPPPRNWKEVSEGLRIKDLKNKNQPITDSDREAAGLGSSEKVVYRSMVEGGIERVDAFLKEFADVPTLDRVLSPDEGTYFGSASKLYSSNCLPVNLIEDYDLIQKEIIKAYELCRDDTYRLAFIDSISDIVCINLEVSARKICENRDVLGVINKMHRIAEKDVRFHRNNYGVVTFLVLSKDYVRNMQ